jgi:hypothetical protein
MKRVEIAVSKLLNMMTLTSTHVSKYVCTVEDLCSWQYACVWGEFQPKPESIFQEKIEQARREFIFMFFFLTKTTPIWMHFSLGSMYNTKDFAIYSLEVNPKVISAPSWTPQELLDIKDIFHVNLRVQRHKY